jgi:hypothetical protein
MGDCVKSYLTCEGGLGNQLFTWNAAHYLRAHCDSVVTILLPKESNRRIELLELSELCEHGIRIREADAFYTILRISDRLVRRLPKAKQFLEAIGLISYESPNDKIGQINKTLIVHRGYFQNIEMVDDQMESVLGEITRLTNATFLNFKKKIDIPGEFEAFHIRRGDFKPNSSDIGVLSDRYYKRLQSELPLIISTEAASDLTDRFGAIYVSTDSTDTNWESFSLLSHATRLISANSTFSWWAGKVAKYRNQESVVVQPSSYQKNIIDANNLLEKEFIQVEADYL